MTNLRKVLIIEDDKELLDFYTSMCETVEDQVICTIATNGEEGVKSLETEKFEAIILDLVMPGTDGYGVLDYLKDCQLNKFVPVTVLTNLDTEEDRIKTKALGVNRYFVKADLSNAQIKSILRGEDLNA